MLRRQRRSSALEHRWRASCRGTVDRAPRPAINPIAVIEGPSTVVAQEYVAAVVVIPGVQRIILDRHHIGELSRVWLGCSVPDDSIGAREIGRLTVAGLVHRDRADHVHRPIRKLRDVPIVYVQESTVIDDQNAVVEGEKIRSSDAVYTIVTSVSSVPAPVKEPPTASLLQWPRSVDVLKRPRLRSQHGYAHIGHPIKRVLLPIDRIEAAAAQALNFDYAGCNLPLNRHELG